MERLFFKKKEKWILWSVLMIHFQRQLETVGERPIHPKGARSIEHLPPHLHRRESSEVSKGAWRSCPLPRAVLSICKRTCACTRICTCTYIRFNEDSEVEVPKARLKSSREQAAWSPTYSQKRMFRTARRPEENLNRGDHDVPRSW